MIVCIAEKPSVAKDIARIIGATSSRDGYMEGVELGFPADDSTALWNQAD